MDRKQQIEHLYSYILGREADIDGLNHYLDSNLSLYEIQLNLWQSDEFKNKFKESIPEDLTETIPSVPIYIINLLWRPDRKNSIENSLKNLKISGYEFIEAVDKFKLTQEQLDIDYNKEESFKKKHRLLTDGEIACALSHVKCLKKIVDEDLDYALILEDDAILTYKFKKFIENFNIDKNEFDVIAIGAMSSNQFYNGKCKLSKSPYQCLEAESIIYLDEIIDSVGEFTRHSTFYPSRELDFIHGGHAYLVSNKGAKKLLEKNYPVVVEADNIWNYHFDIDITIMNPLLVYRQSSDSDLKYERDHATVEADHFIDKINHPDFGT